MKNKINESIIFLKLIDLSPACIFFTDILGNCTYVNAHWKKISGMSPQVALNQGWSEAIHPEDREKVINAWTSATIEERPLRLEFRLIKPDGVITWVDTEAVKIFDESNQFVGYSGTLTDVTSLRISETIREQQLYFSKSANQIAEIIISNNNALEIINKSKKILDETLKIENYTIPEIKNINYQEFINYWIKHIQDLKKWNKDETFFLESVSKLLEIGLIKIKLMEKNFQTLGLLTEERNQLAAAFENSNIGFVLANPEGNDIFMNPAAKKFHGISTPINAPALVRDYTNDWELRYEDRQIMPFTDWPLLKAIRGEFLSEFKIIYLNKKDNKEWICSMTTMPIKDAKGVNKYFFLTILDITKEYNLEKELRGALLAAKTSEMAKSRFLDIAAHELRTPVTAFSILLQLTQKRLIEGRAVELVTLNQLKKQVDRISHLVVDLLDVSRLERGLIRLKLETVDLASLINDCIEDTKLKYQMRNFIYKKPNHLINVIIDKIRIYQVIMNLLENAHKYTAETLPIEITIELFNQKIRVSIKDHGHGIPIEQQEKLFTPLSRGSIELTEQSGGLGLGLYICREIIKLHEGIIGVESKINIGSTFYFELPTG